MCSVLYHSSNASSATPPIFIAAISMPLAMALPPFAFALSCPAVNRDHRAAGDAIVGRGEKGDQLGDGGWRDPAGVVGVGHRHAIGGGVEHGRCDRVDPD